MYRMVHSGCRWARPEDTPCWSCGVLLIHVPASECKKCHNVACDACVASGTIKGKGHGWTPRLQAPVPLQCSVCRAVTPLETAVMWQTCEDYFDAWEFSYKCTACDAKAGANANFNRRVQVPYSSFGAPYLRLFSRYCDVCKKLVRMHDLACPTTPHHTCYPCNYDVCGACASHAADSAPACPKCKQSMCAPCVHESETTCRLCDGTKDPDDDDW